MKHEIHQFHYKSKRNKKLNKLVYHDDSNNKLYPQKFNNYVKKVNEIMSYIDTDLNKPKQNSVIRRKEIEKSLIYLKNVFKTLKHSFNNITNTEENSNLYNQIKETKENVSLNEINKGMLTTKSKKINSANKEIHKNNFYHNNSCIKKSNYKKNQNYNNGFPNKQNLIQVLNTANKSKIVLKKSSNSNYKNINININTNINNEIKSNKKIKSYGLLPIENSKNTLMKMLNNNDFNKNNNINTENNFQNYYSQKNYLVYRNNNKNDFNIKTSKASNNYKEENVFNYNEEKQVELTKEEKALYGDRIMKGYLKIKLLGKGGYGVVWLCQNNLNQKECAVKQTSKKKNQENSHNLNNIITNARNEISILNLLNNKNINNEELNISNNDMDIDDENNNDNIYCEIIPKIYDFYEDNNDIWFSFEKGGRSLSNLCFKIKGEFEKGERIYLIQKGQFLISLFSNINQFKFLLKQLIIGINYINNKGIIHSDIKPENILIEYTYNSDLFYIDSVKIIDYGSSFLYSEITTSSNSNTPEYLCPEITIGNKKFVKDLSNSDKYINAVDVWSLGITFLEMCLCCPIWMNFKSKITINGKVIYSNGIFGCRMRDSNKIYNKQIEVRKNLNKLLKNSLLYMFEKPDRDNFIDLLGKMLNIDYTKRINTEEILKHPFLDEIN